MSKAANIVTGSIWLIKEAFDRQVLISETSPSSDSFSFANTVVLFSSDEKKLSAPIVMAPLARSMNTSMKDATILVLKESRLVSLEMACLRLAVFLSSTFLTVFKMIPIAYAESRT